MGSGIIPPSPCWDTRYVAYQTQPPSPRSGVWVEAVNAFDQTMLRSTVYCSLHVAPASPRPPRPRVCSTYPRQSAHANVHGGSL